MYIVDRIEGDFALVEQGEHILNIPLVNLPNGVREGSVLRVNDRGSFEIDEGAGKARSRKLKDRFSSMLEK